MLEKLRDNFGFKGCSVPNQHLCVCVRVCACVCVCVCVCVWGFSYYFLFLLQNPKAALSAATAPERALMRARGLGFRV